MKEFCDYSNVLIAFMLIFFAIETFMGKPPDNWFIGLWFILDALGDVSEIVKNNRKIKESEKKQ